MLSDVYLLAARARENYERYADLLGGAANPLVPRVEGRRLLSVLDEPKLRRVLSRMLDETRFLRPHGIRSLSRSHLDEPFAFAVHGQQYRVQYLPAESDTGMFGGKLQLARPDRLISIFRRDDTGQRPVYGGMTTFQVDTPDNHGRSCMLSQVWS